MVNSLLLALALTALTAEAADISQCNLKKTADDRAECMAGIVAAQPSVIRSGTGNAEVTVYDW
jgi:CHASE1-domain containing sensor protein